MRTRLKRRFNIKPLISGGLTIFVFTVLSAVTLKSIPLLGSFGQTVKVASALLVMPEGALELLSEEKEVSEEPLPVYEEVSEESVTTSEPAIAEENKAELVHKTYTAAPSKIYIPLENGFIKNCTSHTAEEIIGAIKTPPAFTIEDTDKPQVLIMHTHTTESYFPFEGEYYDKTYSSRSTDNSQNMVAVGEKIKTKLQEYGISVLHDKTQHDYPSYNGSYDRSAVPVKEYLKKYPSIKIVLDVHRDAIISGDTATAPIAEINGKTAAQVMIINGCANDNINYPDFFKNLSFAADLQNQLEMDYQGLTRPLLFDYRKYNQHLTTGSILLEVGGHANTLEQALYSGELIGNSLGRLLTGYIKGE